MDTYLEKELFAQGLRWFMMKTILDIFAIYKISNMKYKWCGKIFVKQIL